MLPTFWGEDLLLHASLDENRIVSFLLAGILALNGYLAVRNFAFSFFGPGERDPELSDLARGDAAVTSLPASPRSALALTGDTPIRT
jgi:hypothetical protein